MKTEGQNKNIDLQKKALDEFELKDVKELLNKIKEFSFQINENDLKKLDKDDNSLSETEKELLKKSKKTLDMIKFLEGLVVELEKKEKGKNKEKTKENQSYGNFMTPFKSDRMYATKFRKSESNGFPSINIESSNEKIKREENILKNILEKYSNNIDNLLITDTLEAKQDIKKILELYIINSSDCMAFSNKYYTTIKDKLLNKLNTDLIKKLNGYKFENGEKIDVNKIFFESACKVDNLISKLAELRGPNGKKLSTQEIQDIIFGIATIKEDKSLKTLKDIFKKYSLTLDNFKGKDINGILTIFKEKNIPKEQQKIILSELENIGNINKAKDINSEDTEIFVQTYEYMKLNGSYKENFNKAPIKFFENNPKKIVNITDENKLLKILNNKTIKEEIIKGKIEDFINPSLLGDIAIILKILDFKKLNTYNLKNLGKLKIADLTKLSNKLGKYLSEATLSNFIILRYDIDVLSKNFNPLFKEKKEKQNENLIKIMEKLSIFDSLEKKDKIDSKMFLINLISKDITITDIKNNNSKEIKKGENYSKKVKLEYTLIYKMNKSEKEAEKIMKLFSKDINLLYQFPLVIKYIISNKKNINKMIEINPNFYIDFIKTNYNENNKSFGPITKVQATEINTNVDSDYNKKYIDSILNNPNIKNKEEYLSKLKFSNFKQLLETFKYLKSNKNIKFQKILGYEEIRNNLKSLQLNKNPQEILKTLQGEDRKLFILIQKTISKFFSESIKIYTDRYNTEKKNYTIDENKFKNNNTIKNLKEQYPYFKKEIEQLIELIKGGKDVNEKVILANFAIKFGRENLEEFGNFLTTILKAVKKETTEKGKETFNGLQKSEREKLIKKDIYTETGELTNNFKDKLKHFYISKIKDNNKKLDNTTIIQLFLQKYKLIIKPNTKIFTSIETQLSVLINSKIFEQIATRINNTKTDEEKRKLYSQIVNKDKEFYESIQNETVKSMETNLNNDSTINNNGENNNSFKVSIFSKSEENNYTIKVNGEELTGLTQEEIKDIGIKKDKDGNIIVENPDILENTINFYKFFKDLNLLGVWKYRKELTKSMGDININLEDDSLKKRELVKFGNKLIHFINNLPKNEKSKDIQLNENLDELSKIETELRKFSQANSMLSSGKTFNNLGEDILTANLRDLGIIGGACFHTMQFRDIMNGNINSNQKKNERNTST